MKRLFVVLLLLLAIMMSNVVFATDVEVQINGEIINFEDTSAQIINARTMVPFRRIFNELGVSNENILWDGDTKIIVAKKDGIEIELQIGNNIAKKKVGDLEEKITLDSPPVIRNSRTLVPLRFIAESLGKTVGWDSANKTAIIIDYDYFMQAINSKSSELYNFINKKSNNYTVSIKRNYMDLDNASNNNTAIITFDINEENSNGIIKQNAKGSFSGTNEMMKEISEEGWSQVEFESEFYDDYFTIKALNDGLKKVFGQEQLKFKYTGLKCEGNPTDSFTNLLKNISELNENSINIQTFKTRKDEFNKLLGLFKSNGNGELTTGNISSESVESYYFDFTRFDNVIFDSPVNRVYSFFNSQIFKYDVSLKELIYDYPKINISLKASNSELTIDFVLANEYNEKVEYVITINK